MKYCADKDFNTFVRQLVRQGWSFQRGGKHGRLTAPTGRPILAVPSTPSDYRALLNFRRDMRNAQKYSLVTD